MRESAQIGCGLSFYQDVHRFQILIHIQKEELKKGIGQVVQTHDTINKHGFGDKLQNIQSYPMDDGWSK